MDYAAYGEAFLSHYEKFLGNYTNTRVFSCNTLEFPIQILEYPNTIPKCDVYASMGFSKYSSSLNNIVELFVAVEEKDDSLPSVISEIIFFTLNNKLTLGRGTSLSGIDNINPEFVLRWQKPAFYYTLPFNVPPGFESFEIDKQAETGYMMTGFFISESEYDYIQKHGPQNFEKIFESKGIDPFIISRPSAV